MELKRGVDRIFRMAQDRLQVDQLIYTIRGHRVMLDRDLAKIYGVSTARLNQQVSRNKERFPEDFMFRLSKSEIANWILRFATSNSALKMGLRKPPSAFTEHGAVTVAASIQIVRAFNRLRRTLAHKNLALALTELMRRLAGHGQ